MFPSEIQKAIEDSMKIAGESTKMQISEILKDELNKITHYKYVWDYDYHIAEVESTRADAEYVKREDILKIIEKIKNLEIEGIKWN